MIIDKERLKSDAEYLASTLDAFGKPMESMPVPPSTILALLAEIERLDAKCTAIGKYVAICKQHKRNYLRAVKWLMAHTNFEPKDIPEPVYITLKHVADRLIAKAQRAAQGR